MIYWQIVFVEYHLLVIQDVQLRQKCDASCCMVVICSVTTEEIVQGIFLQALLTLLSYFITDYYSYKRVSQTWSILWELLEETPSAFRHAMQHINKFFNTFLNWLKRAFSTLFTHWSQFTVFWKKKYWANDALFIYSTPHSLYLITHFAMALLEWHENFCHYIFFLYASRTDVTTEISTFCSDVAMVCNKKLLCPSSKIPDNEKCREIQ